jgi:hypothetical protein
MLNIQPLVPQLKSQQRGLEIIPEGWTVAGVRNAGMER